MASFGDVRPFADEVGMGAGKQVPALRPEKRDAECPGHMQVFEGHAYYQSEGEGEYEGKWFDSQAHPSQSKAT